jgi:membrane protein YdbS with pleckstrin-like domain
MGLSVIAHKAAHFAATVLNNPWSMGTLASCLVFVPILGIWAVHKYKWEHWEPFSKSH